ncbi:very long chain fatty acid elongase 1-like [Lycorma delicatula]|uniref:very long chain fatty acid elongase 1-like n=1 Tax=Lycorma delicatula TaxID=130591 RepID=UPI003F51ABE3
MFGALRIGSYNVGENITVKEQLEIEEAEINSLFLMEGPWPICVILVSYLYFVLKRGPQYMLNRKAYDLKGFMVLYNLIQVLYNVIFFAWLSTSGILPFLIKQSCNPDPNADLQSRLIFFRGLWMWFLLKVIDLCDTVIFILRKKQSQVTFLHVYHHAAVVLSTWLHIKYVRGEQSVAVGFLNSFVHAVMYTYYLLAALGPSVQPYLWWKRYLTKLQLIQFVSMLIWFTYLSTSCEVPFSYKMYNWFCISQAVVFFALFLSFYFKSYKTKEKAQ